MRRFDGARVRQFRTARHISPEHLAIDIGRSGPTLRAYEQGRLTPSAEALVALADALGVAVDDLFSPKPAEVPA